MKKSVVAVNISVGRLVGEGCGESTTWFLGSFG